MKNAAVGDICEQIRGVTYAKSDASDTPQSGYTPILRANNIQDNGRLLLEDFVFVPDSKISPKQRVIPNDVVVAASSGSISVVGKTAQAEDEFDGGFGAFCKVLRPNSEVAPRYFGHYFRTQAYRRIVSHLAAGANINNLKNEHLDNLQIPLPPLAEQKRIAAILDAADALRAKRRESLEQLDTLLQSTFLEMFGDPVTNPMGWDKGPITTLGSLDRGKSTHRPRNEPSLIGGDHPLIQTGDISRSDGFIRSHSSTYSDKGLAQSKIWDSGTLCITIAANIADTALLTYPACFPDSVVGFVAKKASSAIFVQGVLRHFQQILENKASQVAQKNINLGVLRNLEIPIPPLDLQHRFASIVESVEEQKSAHRNHLEELDTLFASLQQRAFSGEL